MNTTTRLFMLAVAIFCWLVLLSRLAHACEIEPGDWAEVEEQLENG
jgi:hypothetical protein